MRAAWFHCFSGIAGDMALGALLDAGADVDEVRAVVARLPVEGWSLDVSPVSRAGIGATHAVVIADEGHVHRTFASIRTLLEAAVLPERVHRRALAVFERLAVAEGRVHRVDPDDVEFHEVGALDALVDVVGSCAALEVLGVDVVHASPVAVGHGGVVRGAHGPMPNPVPASLVLLEGAPVHGVDVAMELVTPTGAALLAALVGGWGPLPAMTIDGVGYGAGTRELAERPNLVQVVVGDLAVAETGGAGVGAGGGQPVIELEANVDDVTGEVLAHAVGALLAAGAHDAWITPIVMKKGRPAFTVHALVDPTRARAVASVLGRETGTFGIRGHMLERWPVARAMETVEVDGQSVRIKVSAGRAKAEFDDAVRAAATLDRPVRDVLAAAEAAWQAR